MDNHQVIEQMKRDFVGKSPEEVLGEFTRRKIEPWKRHLILMIAYTNSYHLVDSGGKRIDYEGVIADSTRGALEVCVPDLEARLPWYEAMFRILDKGEFNDGTDNSGAGPWYFSLEDGLREELMIYLREKTAAGEAVARFLVSRLTRDLGNPPGLQFNTALKLGLVGPSYYARNNLICGYLHAPLRKIITVNTKETIANLLYDGLIKEYVPPPHSVEERL